MFNNCLKRAHPTHIHDQTALGRAAVSYRSVPNRGDLLYVRLGCKWLLFRNRLYFPMLGNHPDWRPQWADIVSLFWASGDGANKTLIMFPLRSLCVPKCRFPQSWYWHRHYHGLLTRRFGLFSYIITWNILLYFDLEPLTSPFGSVRLMTQSGPTTTHYSHTLIIKL